ncbi:MAG: type II secretion system F family protein [Proteobacteria bacterium]|nr:type II secretion system F family protein [Pseudomonadota bacterium]
MQRGRPLHLKDLLPRGMSEDQFYMLAAVLVVLLIAGIFWGMRKRNPMSARIKAIQERRKFLQGESMSPTRRKKKPETSVNFMRAVVTRLQLLKNSQLGKTQQLLIEAGFRSKDAIYVYTFFTLVLPIVLGVVGLVVMQYMVGHVSPKWKLMNYIWPVLGAYMGMKLPGMYTVKARKKRYLMVQRALPDVLDLMTICAEAGLSLVAMLDRVAKELAISYPEIAEEVSMTSIEIGFLPDRNKALLNLAERCQLPEIRGLVSVLIQTEKYGTPIAQALRVLSAEFRTARMLRAEQKAARLPALMTIPMICFILPTLFIVIIAPAAVKLMDTIKDQ